MWRLLFPLLCPSCGATCRDLCPGCRDLFPPRTGCFVPPGLDALLCPFAYDGAVKRLVLASKATPAHGLLEVMAGLLSDPIAAPRFQSSITPSAAGDAFVVTWATGSAVHRRKRGYDPAERLARRYAHLHGLRCSGLLRRVGGPQEGRTAAERAALSFRARRSLLPPGQRAVLLVDDVVTTGSSMSRAAQALRRAGADVVVGVAFAQVSGR